MLLEVQRSSSLSLDILKRQTVVLQIITERIEGKKGHKDGWEENEDCAAGTRHMARQQKNHAPCCLNINGTKTTLRRKIVFSIDQYFFSLVGTHQI